MVLALGLTKMSTTDMYVLVYFSSSIDVVGVFFYVSYVCCNCLKFLLECL